MARKLVLAALICTLSTVQATTGTSFTRSGILSLVSYSCPATSPSLMVQQCWGQLQVKESDTDLVLFPIFPICNYNLTGAASCHFDSIPASPYSQATIAATAKVATGTVNFESGYNSNCSMTYTQESWKMQPSGDTYGLVMYSPADTMNCLYYYTLAQATSTILGVNPRVVSSGDEAPMRVAAGAVIMAVAALMGVVL